MCRLHLVLIDCLLSVIACMLGNAVTGLVAVQLVCFCWFVPDWLLVLLAILDCSMLFLIDGGSSFHGLGVLF